jgi:hypothetical protein
LLPKGGLCRHLHARRQTGDHHIDISWNQGCTGTDQVRFFELEGDTLTITTAPYRRYLDGHESRSMLEWDKVPGG